MKKEELGKRRCNDISGKNNIEIKCTIFCLEERKLKVLVIKNESDFTEDKWKLPGASLPLGETMFKTAQKIVRESIFSDDFFLEQLKAFEYDSSLFGENVSIGFYALVRGGETDADNENLSSDMNWIAVNDVDCLEEKHLPILDFSLRELKKNMRCSAVGFKLLPEKFTLLQVIHLYEEILGIEINKVNFRRKILQRGLVNALDEKEEGVSYRAAKFYCLNILESDMLWSTKFNFNF
ncbi:NUDIX hydrolase [Flavobacterium sp. DG2-3]|uniref:NUDIX hydrolase n=1 Tax=Flavobacterium sp. DG2-3 TaxID=3068317 RepID=UPI00273E6812|nr:NUDIX hydrolase [Flavobacterium sp. DG2-3]MDP5200265.1 NUDIX hydrolase [Flavobacterium sp. DG2-3]